MQKSNLRNTLFQIIFLTLFLFLMYFWRINADFYDVQEDHPYWEAIDYLRKAGVIPGSPTRTYHPDEPIERWDFILMVTESLFNKEEIRGCKALSSSDVKPSTPYAQHICLAYKHGLIISPNDEVFQAEDNLELAEVARTVLLAYGENKTSPTLKPKAYINQLAELKAIPPSIISLEQEITRGEMAEMIYRVSAKIKDKPSQFSKILTANEPRTDENLISSHEDNLALKQDEIKRELKNDLPQETKEKITPSEELDQKTTNSQNSNQNNNKKLPPAALNGVPFEQINPDEMEWEKEAFQKQLDAGLNEVNNRSKDKKK